MFRPEIIDHTHDQECANRRERYVLTQNPYPCDVFGPGRDVAETGPATQRRGDSEIGQQQQSAYDRE